MVETAGTKLKRARKLRKLGLEDVSRATKIRVQQLIDLEADEYSNFANLAYAKNFLVAYARYLHIDARPYLDGFADAGTFGLDDYQYLSEKPVGIYRAPQRRQARQFKPKRHQFVLAAMTLGFLTVVGVVWFALGVYERLGGDLDKLAAHQEARERAAAEAVGRPAAVVVPASLVEPTPVPVNNATPPVPSVAPMDETERTVAAALASADTTAVPPAARPVLPVPGDGDAARQVLQPLARRPAVLRDGRSDGSEPQKVVNSQGRK